MANNEKDLRGSGNPNDRNENPANQENKNKNTTGNTGRTGTSNRGFASMDEARHREISAMGGRASHESGRGHEFDSEEAREAGRKGGQASHGGRGSKSSTSDTDDTGEVRGGTIGNKPDQNLGSPTNENI